MFQDEVMYKGAMSPFEGNRLMMMMRWMGDYEQNQRRKKQRAKPAVQLGGGGGVELP